MREGMEHWRQQPIGTRRRSSDGYVHHLVGAEPAVLFLGDLSDGNDLVTKVHRGLVRLAPGPAAALENANELSLTASVTS